MRKEIQLLLIEDSVDDTELILLELQDMDYSFGWKRVETAQELRAVMEAQSWDLIISDFNLPGFKGPEALKIVREYDAFCPFILVSGTIGEEEAVRVMRAGAQDYILKQNLTRLPTAVHRGYEDAQIKRRAERDALALKETNERLQLIYDNSTDGISLLKITDSKLFFEFANIAFFRLYSKLSFSIDNEVLAGLSLPYFFKKVTLLDADGIFERLEKYNGVIKSGKQHNYVEEIQFQDRVLHLETFIIPIMEDERCTQILRVERDISDRILAENKMKQAYVGVDRLKGLLEEENRYLKEEIGLKSSFEDLAFGSDKFKQLLEEVEQVAPVDATVLIYGETGTGKELIVKAVHNLSRRKHYPLIKVNCAALPYELIESELFGYEKGAFTGAIQQRKGRFELAQNGTLFLDEIGELPLELQPKLLRVIQEGELERIGGTKTIPLNIRIIAATNKDLKKLVEQGKFREDLYYRLNVFPIQVPPLRERKEDIIPLLDFFLGKYSKKFNKSVEKVSPESFSILEEYEWPGNVRELEHLVERAIIISKDGVLSFAPLLGINPEKEVHHGQNLIALKVVEKKHILKILKICDWKINGPGGAAEKLELTPSTLRDRMKKYGIRRPS